VLAKQPVELDDFGRRKPLESTSQRLGLAFGVAVAGGSRRIKQCPER
jgi:hypothetical protein